MCEIYQFGEKPVAQQEVLSLPIYAGAGSPVERALKVKSMVISFLEM